VKEGIGGWVCGGMLVVGECANEMGRWIDRWMGYCSGI